MAQPDASTMLRVWERGDSHSNAQRALLLLSAALPHSAEASLAELSVGHRDAHLLALRQQLFGSRLECLTTCPSCAEQIELRFGIDEIRTGHALPDAAHRLEADGVEVHFRVPRGSDLLAIAHERDGESAQKALLARCVLQPAASDLPAHVIELLDQHMSELDPQAEVQLHVTCTGCGRQTRALFDIVTHLWTELDAWARALLRDVHAIASSYGWSEAEILGMSPARQRAYLELIGA